MHEAALSKSLLEAKLPTTGRAADAYEVARTAIMLDAFKSSGGYGEPGNWFEAARHATLLHVISGRLHRIAERQCNEDLACPRCQGQGKAATVSSDRYMVTGLDTCRACAGHGTTLGRSQARLGATAKAIAEHYGLRVYFQGDPRGCSLYLIDPAIIPKAVATLNGEGLPPNPDYWIASNYDRGHAVVRLGR